MVLGHLDIHLVKKYIIRPLLHTPHQTQFQHLPSTPAPPLSSSHSTHVLSPGHWETDQDLHRRLTSQQATPIVETSVANGARKGCQGAHCQLRGKGWSAGLSGGSKAERNGLAGMGLPDKVRAEGGSGRCKGTEPGSFCLGPLAS